MLFLRSIFFADIPYLYGVILLGTISSHAHQITLNEPHLLRFLLPCTLHHDKIPASHDSRRSASVFRSNLPFPTNPAVSDMRIHFQARAEWPLFSNRMAFWENGGQTQIWHDSFSFHVPDVRLH